MKLTILIVILFPEMILAEIPFPRQGTTFDSESTRSRLTVTAVRVTNPVVIDGMLTETEWQRPGTTNFTQRDPVEGASPTERTEVWVAYDDEALYIAARMYDSHPDSIVARIGRRDADVNSDWFYFAVDSYHDRRNAFFFAVNPGGSIQDGTFYNDDWSDNSWDGVWDAATRVDAQGWTVEMKIPYSQLRFPKLDEYVWGINFMRSINRKNEEDWFVMVPKKESGTVSRFADLVGIRDINPPARVEILPYAVSSSTFTNKYDAADPFHSSTSLSGNIGADIKIGLGSNLTLNGTINPDFGQVEVDPAVVNLTQFETFYDEKRPFFIEGTNFFNFGNGGINNNWSFNWGSPQFFYSRRIGRPPEGSVQHSGYSDVPDRTAILGAGKITGKIADGWSLATVHAFTAQESARVDSSGVRFEDVVEPFTSYNVVRTLREFNQGKQAIGFIGTGTLRDLNQAYLADEFNRSSYTLGADGWTNLDSSQTYVTTAWLATSRVQGSASRILSLQKSPLHYYQRPDARSVSIDSSATWLSGYAGRIAINKQKGNFYLNSALGIISPGFESNDMGFLFRTNEINSHIVLGYQWFNPDGAFRRKSFYIATFRNYDFDRNKVGDGYFLMYNMQFMNYWGTNGNLMFTPVTLDNQTTRGGPLMASTNHYASSIYFNTDSRDPMVCQLQLQAERSESGGYFFQAGPEIDWKSSSTLKLSFSPQFFRDVTVAQWVTNVVDPSAIQTFGGRYVFAKLDQRQLSADIRVDWTFTPKLTLQLYLQPLISIGSYSQFKELKQPGTYTFNRYGIDNNSTVNYIDSTNQYLINPDGTGNHNFAIDNPDFNFKSLRGNMVLRWEYLPGSTIYFVWTQQRTNDDDAGDFQFGRDVSHLLSAQGDNIFLVKVTYWWNP